MTVATYFVSLSSNAASEGCSSWTVVLLFFLLCPNYIHSPHHSFTACSIVSLCIRSLISSPVPCSCLFLSFLTVKLVALVHLSACKLLIYQSLLYWIHLAIWVLSPRFLAAFVTNINSKLLCKHLYWFYICVIICNYKTENIRVFHLKLIPPLGSSCRTWSPS